MLSVISRALSAAQYKPLRETAMFPKTENSVSSKCWKIPRLRNLLKTETHISLQNLRLSGLQPQRR